ncbi:MAG: transcription-repair coupling factor, partial [Acidobacteria bacterium]|nr:transcription-repair coupling factor [Acidobacteriota bacterium]
FESALFSSIKWVLVSEKDILGRGVTLAEKTSRKRELFFEGLRDLKAGDYVVHIEHGIGIYKGIETIKRNNRNEDYIRIEYAENGKLLLPIERLDLLQKYKGSEGYKPQLDKLGTLSFKKRKDKAKKAAKEIAEDLINIYASRKNAECSPCFGDEKLEEEFENLFPYDLTTDQKKALEDVKRDLESTTPMDRIICGDVGFGKTEVAMRAAFKVVNSGKQVAILCPTTVLALQHFENFKERFSLFPVRIEMLSSLINSKRQKKIVKDIKAGMVDIVIGTHRILSKDVDFPRLGLFIVDEEQRFGVLHKERIKKSKPWIHFLNLSATPIPRTLQMGISTIVDMSLIETPPKDRLSIDTIFSVYDDELVKSAIRKEIKREGQVFYLYNKVEDIEQKGAKIKQLVPEAKIIVAHGQLKKSELEKRMVQFYHHQADILLSTTIIENGVDIPKANTLIVENAHNFGLTELYQIRGRIGRSNIPAYAYLLIPPKGQISKDAVERLRTLEEFTELGSGFRIAAIDLELRGAGTLLGREQSGHIESIGFELYMG